MGQGLYRCLGWGCLNPPLYDWDLEYQREQISLLDILKRSYEAKPDYLMIPISVDDSFLQAWWSLSALPEGLPHVEPRTAVTVPRCEWWPDYGKSGVWVSSWVVSLWELICTVAQTRGLELPAGEPIFVCDWD